jgi:serine/threonine-protein kinase
VTEAKTTVELSHPNIVPVYELGVEQGIYFIAMEFAEGATLAELLRASGTLSPEEGAYLGVEILRALDYAHRKAAVVHRDVTPRNVLIDEEGAVRLIDFGIAAPVSGESARKERVFGSPGHMPPEQRDGGRLTPATDVFAVGALLIEAWTGRAPFRRATTEESDAAVRQPAPAPSLSQAALASLDDLVARSVAADALARPQTAEDFARPLRDFLRSADLGDIARRLGERVRKARRAETSKRRGASSSTSERPPSGPVTPIMSTPATPSTRRMDPVTETFATREEVVEWTQRGSAFPKAVETPASGATRAQDKPSARLRRGAVFAAVALVVVVVAITVRKPVPPDRPVTTRPLSEPQVPVATVPTPSEPVASAPTATPLLSSEPPSTATALASAERASAGAADGVVFNITSDMPGTKVLFDGSPIGLAPIATLRRPAGKHTVTFLSDELEERLSASVPATAGELVKVRALFKNPTPTIAIKR